MFGYKMIDVIDIPSMYITLIFVNRIIVESKFKSSKQMAPKS